MSRYFNFLEKASFYLFVFFLPFSFKKIIYSGGNFFYNYQTIFLYLADAFFFLALFFYFLTKPKINFEKKDLLFFLFLVVCLIGSIFSSLKLLSFLRTFRLLAGFLVYFYLRNNSNVFKVKNILTVFAVSGILESLIAIWQFSKQQNIGLKFLGEPIFSPFVLGAAKLKIAGAKVIRPPGTLPHANILAAFLFFALVALFYLYLKQKNFSFVKRIGFFLANFILVGGLFLSFSRSAWIVLFVFWVVFWFFVLSFKADKKDVLKFLAFFLVVVLAFSFFVIVFKGIFLQRTRINLSEKAINLRLIYQKISLKIIKQKPIFGTGFGNYINFASRNSLWAEYGLKYTYLFRPVHNIYLLLAAEAGLAGLALFLGYIFFVLKDSFKKIKKAKNILKATLFAGVVGFLVWGLSDHFFVDLTQGNYLFWLAIGSLGLKD